MYWKHSSHMSLTNQSLGNGVASCIYDRERAENYYLRSTKVERILRGFDGSTSIMNASQQPTKWILGGYTSVVKDRTDIRWDEIKLGTMTNVHDLAARSMYLVISSAIYDNLDDNAVVSIQIGAELRASLRRK
ncbi:hypothetical protein M426DRAFT_174307 [Hypoxylon sp. CI-4A]|nr:hypothetical protein M426DRAFT_174307 [Hypoxylon sp. CI-4A]